MNTIFNNKNNNISDTDQIELGKYILFNSYYILIIISLIPILILKKSELT